MMLEARQDEVEGCGDGHCQVTRILYPLFWKLLKGVCRSNDRLLRGSRINSLADTLSYADSYLPPTLPQFQLQHAPALYFFPPSTGPFASNSQDPVTYDFNRNGFEGQVLASSMSQTLGVKVPYSKPFPIKIFLIASTSIFFGICFIFVVIPKLNLNFSLSSGTKFLWMTISLATIVIMTSGYMFNSIRNTPFVGFSQGGKPEYFSGGFQSQYRAETQIVAGLCEYSGFLKLFFLSLQCPFLSLHFLFLEV